jgi:hypothetical protein
MKKRFIFIILFLLIGIIFFINNLFFENRGNGEFSLNYASLEGFPGFKEVIINISKLGEYNYLEYSINKPIYGIEEKKELMFNITGKLNEEELTNLTKFIIDKKDFFNFPFNLDNNEVFDGVSYFMQVSHNGKKHKIKGYGINNPDFLEIVSLLYDYKIQFMK